MTSRASFLLTREGWTLGIDEAGVVIYWRDPHGRIGVEMPDGRVVWYRPIDGGYVPLEASVPTGVMRDLLAMLSRLIGASTPRPARVLALVR